MINNISENNKSTTTSATKAIVDNRQNSDVELNDAAAANKKSGGVSVVQTTYGHGIWYSEIIDSANITSNNNAIDHKQQYCNNANSSSNASNNNIRENIVNRNVWLSTGSGDVPKKQQQQSHNSHTNNECDIIIVDMEEDDNNDEVARQQQQQQQPFQLQHSVPSKFFINANLKFSQTHATAIYESERCLAKNNFIGINNNNIEHIANDDHGNANTIEAYNNQEIEREDEEDSLASMETLSDNVSIWIDGEKHWVAGVDATTTCSDLIWALLNYQSGQQPNQRQIQQQHQQRVFGVATTIPTTENEENVINKTNSNQCEKHEQYQPVPKVLDKNVIEFNLSMSTNEGSSNLCTGNKPNIQNTAKTNNTSSIPTTTTSTSTTTTSINQSMPINTKENCKIIQNLTLATASTQSSATPIISSSAPVPAMPPLPPQATHLPLTLPPGIATVSQLATEYVIVKQYHHCEEYLDGSTKVFDVLPPRDDSNKKECELLLRHLGPSPAVYINNTTPQLSSLISTDKDSGMGSPVGSARSAKFRRRRHKSSQSLSQANTLHPKLSRCTANERLMKIILAQDETIQRQLSLLREKERQITKIEEEKHRKRERELGKNYLLETYLNGLDEADCEPEIEDGEEIFIDEPYHRLATAAKAHTIAPTGVSSAAGAVTDKILSATEAFNMMAKHKLKDKEVKQEKKKKRHKEKSTKDEGIHARDFNLKTNKNKDKEKVDKIQQQKHHTESKAIDIGNIKDNGSEQEIEMQILWLEKIYTLNKQLQKEEELAAKLHAKVRKHQLRKAQQTQSEVQMEIDKLDNNLALQCGDIRKVEANLMQTNEQLQKKLMLLERLSIEYLQEQQENETHNKQDVIKTKSEHQTIKEPQKPLKNDSNTLLSTLEKSIDIQKLSLNNIKSKEEVIKLEKIIAKPGMNLRPENFELKETKHAVNTMAVTVANNPMRGNTKASFFQGNQRFSNGTSLATNRSISIATTVNQQQHQEPQLNHQQFSTLSTTTALSIMGHTPNSEAARTNDIVSTSCMSIDKNMLSSLHVQNAKTIKKQMFHTQTSATEAAAVSASASVAITIEKVPPPATLTTSSQILLPPPPQPPPVTSAFPKQLFQHSQQQQQHMPLASTFLTSRPQNSHQIQATQIVRVQQPSIASSSCQPSLLTSSTSSQLSSASSTTSVCITKAPHPPTSSSPSASILAMNTVDISQLGTLV